MDSVPKPLDSSGHELPRQQLSFHGKDSKCNSTSLYEDTERDQISSFIQTGDNEDESRGWSLTKKLNVGIFSAGFLLINSGFAMIAPFFPHQAKRRGFNDTQVGLVMSTYQVAGCILFPIYGSLLMKLKPKRMCVAGALLYGISSISFGIIKYTNGTLFAGLCFVIRIIEGNGCAMYTVAATSLLINMFPESKGLITSLVETLFGLGCLVGPALGTVLYNIGGYVLPFVAVGATVIVISVVIFFTIPDLGANEESNHKMLKLLKHPGIIIICIHCFISSIAFTFVDPVISRWLVEKFHPRITMRYVGLLFVGWSGAYTIVSIIAGKLADKGYVYLLLLIGLYGCGFFYLGVAPSPLWEIIIGHKFRSLELTLTSLILTFMFVAMMFVPTFGAATNIAKLNGLTENLDLYGKVSGLLFSAMEAGNAVGPTLSGYLTDKYGFEWSSTVISFITLSMATLLTSYVTVMKCLQSPLSPTQRASLSEESRELQPIFEEDKSS